MFYIVTRFNVKTNEQETHSQEKFADYKQAMKRYYSILATDIDSDQIAYEIVQVVDSITGQAIASQIITNAPTEE